MVSISAVQSASLLRKLRTEIGANYSSSEHLRKPGRRLLLYILAVEHGCNAAQSKVVQCISYMLLISY